MERFIVSESQYKIYLHFIINHVSKNYFQLAEIHSLLSEMKLLIMPHGVRIKLDILLVPALGHSHLTAEGEDTNF
jgi:hypothetical protein